MAGINSLPLEILQEIVTLLFPGYDDILNARVSCRAFWGVTTSAIYRDIDLNFAAQSLNSATVYDRQFQLLQTIAKDSRLGRYVRSFTNHGYGAQWGDEVDATLNPGVDASTLISAAKNMRNISKAALTPSYLSAHLIANIQDYPQLQDLSVRVLEPIKHIWPMALTSLTRLKWAFQGDLAEYGEPGGWGAAGFLLKVVEKTCPNLESLEIENNRKYSLRSWPETPASANDLWHQYSTDKASPDSTPTLKHLRHFGFYYSSIHGPKVGIPEIESSYLKFVEKHRHVLKSLAIPIHHDQGRNGLEFLAMVLVLLPGLQRLNLVRTELALVPNGHYDFVEGLRFCKELTAALVEHTPLLERFCISDLGCPYNSKVGELFQPLQNLKFLQVSDTDNKVDNNGGWLNFKEYTKDILDFIAKLPNSLEELYVEVRATNLQVEKDDGFNPFCAKKRNIFSLLRRLNSLDIHLWHLDIEGSFDYRCPEKALMLRRLSHQNSESSDATVSDCVKDIWTSTVKMGYRNKCHRLVSQQCEIMEFGIGEGVFEGSDAKEVLWKGFSYEKGRDRYSCEDPEMKEGWPGYNHSVHHYPRFRSRFDFGICLRNESRV